MISGLRSIWFWGASVTIVGSLFAASPKGKVADNSDKLK